MIKLQFKLNSSASLLGKIWKIKDYDDRQSLMLSQRHNVSPLLAKLLNIRGISDLNINNYLNSNLLNNLPDPFSLKDMKKSVERVLFALSNNHNIGIIADYDVDGSTSAAILCNFFNSINYKTILKIPNRLTDGYGPNEKIMEDLLTNKVDLLFTLDCGTTSFKILDKKKYLSIDTIIIDHHISENTLPNVFSIINPNRYDENNNFKDLAAVGVTFLFLLALRKFLREKNFFKKQNISEPNLLSYLDMVALGTVCDIVNLQGYNRLFVKKGIEFICKRNNKGITAIIDNSKIKHTPNTRDLSFIIGPQLNSASRVGESNLASKLLITDNIVEVESIANKLLIYNEKRKLIENTIYNEALDQVFGQEKNNIIIVKGESWHRGVLGIIASKLVEQFNKPALVISFDNNFGFGSGRSIDNIDLGQIIIDLKDKGLLIDGGGHKMAVGLKIARNLYEKFIEQVIYLFNNFDSSIFKKVFYYDLILSLDEINSDIIDNLEKLEPYGKGNPEPKFYLKNVYVKFIKILKEKHILLNLKNNYEKNIPAISFNCVNNPLGDYLIYNHTKKFHLICSINKSNFQNKIQPQLIIHDSITAD